MRCVPSLALPTMLLLGAVALAAGAAPARDARPILPKPSFDNSFCLFPIDETWHVRKPGDRERLTKTIEQMRATIGPERLYAHLGIAIISEGTEPETFALAKQLGIGLVLQGGAIEHHSSAWGFIKLLRDPVKGDRRFAQWFQDGRIADPGKENDPFGIRSCSSCYAKPVYELRREVELARDRRVAQAFKDFPGTVLACSGPIECEIHQGDHHWGDYSPFTIAEFRDYLTHRGIYAKGAERDGLGYPGGGQFADDPSPAQAKGDHPSFNQTFGTDFTTWSLRYWDPVKFPQRVPLDAPGMPAPGTDGCIAGGFDAPRVWPGQATTAEIPAEGNQRFWDAWASVDDAHPGFRSKLLNFWVRDHTRWLADSGVPKDRDFSHQIPGESYGMGRLSQGASAVWTADTPHGSIGITTYFGAASDVDVFRKIVARNPNWGIFEYHPHPIDSLKAPVSEYLHSLYTCIRFRAHILTPIAWPNQGKDFIVSTGPFAEAMKQVMASLPDQPYYNRSYVDYAPPPVSDVKTATKDGKTTVTWSPRIWPDLHFTWTDWEEFDHFAVRDANGKTLATTKEYSAEVSGTPGKITVIAVKQTEIPQLPSLAGFGGYKDRLHWDDCNDFFCDHYRVQVFDSAGAATPSQTADVQQARFAVHARGGEREVWCRADAADANGHLGPFTERLRLNLPRPGRTLVNLLSLHPKVENSPDIHVREITVGGIQQTALFEHPPLTGGGWARAAFSISLPQVKPGQQILLIADLGIKDGADQSDGVVFRVDVNDAQRFSRLIKVDKQWHSVEVDLTADAGKELRLTLMTNPNGNSAADWAAWGEPHILLVGKGVVELPQVTGIVALGKEVRGRVTLRWDDKASDGTLWSKTEGFSGFRVYRGATRDFQISPANRLGETHTHEFIDTKFDGRETYYRVTAVFAHGADGSESPPSEAVQYAP